MIVALILQQAALPPPPAPDASTGIGLWQIVMTIVFGGGAVALALFAMRPWPRLSPAAAHEPAGERTQPVQSTFTVSALTRSTAIATPDAGPVPALVQPEEVARVQEVDPAVADRLRRVLEAAEANHRRRLGDRKSTAPAASPAPRPATNVIPFERPAGANTLASQTLTRMTMAERLARLNAAEPEPGRDQRAGAGEAVQPAGEHWTTAGDLRVLSGGAGANTGRPVAPPAPQPEEEPALVPPELPVDESIPLVSSHTLAESPAGEAAVESPAHVKLPPILPLDDIVPVPVLERPIQEPEDRDSDEHVLAGVSATLRELIYCANVGEMLHGFALYTDAFLFRTMDESGMAESEFRAAFGATGARPKEAWLRLDRVTALERQANGKVLVTVSYVTPDGGASGAPERYRFARDASTGMWFIDDIAPVE